MCTTAAKIINGNWFLIKTRDPVPWMRWDDEIRKFNTKSDKFKKLIVQNPNPPRRRAIWRYKREGSSLRFYLRCGRRKSNLLYQKAICLSQTRKVAMP